MNTTDGRAPFGFLPRNRGHGPHPTCWFDFGHL